MPYKEWYVQYPRKTNTIAHLFVNLDKFFELQEMLARGDYVQLLRQKKFPIILIDF